LSGARAREPYSETRSFNDNSFPDMNAKALTDQFVSAYVKLLDGLHGDVRVLNAIRANIL
jgi:hypothetical protein